MSTDVSTGMRSAQVARAAGVNQQTLRYYERRGLLAEPDRSPGGHRLYPPEAVTVVRVIKAAQRLGFSLDEVTDLLKTGRHSASVGRRPLVIGGAMSGTRFSFREVGRRHQLPGAPREQRASGHGRTDAGLLAHAAAKIAEIDARIDDLRIIRASLITAMEAGCDDLMACARTDSCPLPFTDIGRLPAAN
jgi:DNA-binding transcriptional MerR regulator